nr:hypothetical protein [Tanacetum cinerariifolium]
MNNDEPVTDVNVVKCPPKSKPKGHPKNKRIKGGIDSTKRRMDNATTVRASKKKKIIAGLTRYLATLYVALATSLAITPSSFATFKILNAIMDLALQSENSCTAKDDLRNAYEKCNDISQESRALIDNFLKEGSVKDYELNLSMYEKAAKLEKQMDAKLAWLLKKY